MNPIMIITTSHVYKCVLYSYRYCAPSCLDTFPFSGRHSCMYVCMYVRFGFILDRPESINPIDCRTHIQTADLFVLFTIGEDVRRRTNNIHISQIGIIDSE